VEGSLNEPAPDNSTHVSFTREEANALRADAERTQAANAKAETLAMELAEAQAALTSLKEASKAVPVAPGPDSPSSPSSALQVDPGDTSLTEEEQSDYGESEGFVTKVSKRVFAEMFNKAVKSLEQRLSAIENGVKTVTQTTSQNAQNRFVNEVKSAVPYFDKAVNHQHWQAFLDSRIPGAGISQREALARAHQENSLDDMKVIFSTFNTKYMGEAEGEGKGNGYGGMNPTGGSDNPAPAPKEVKLKMSERRQASEDFIKHRITAAQLEQIKEKFKKAEAEGRIEYD
jgi:hypothetical protein